MKKAIIFDMDGTLWDSAENVAESWNVALREYGYERAPLTKEDMYRVMGKPMNEIAEILFDKVQGEESKALLDFICNAENEYLRKHGGVLYPKIRSTMEELKKNYRLFIVSNCQTGYIEAFLDYYRFHDLVEDMECYGTNGMPKAENIRLICNRNNISPQMAVYVGDIQGDYDASMAAGVKFIHASYGFGTISEEVVEIKTFSDLPEAAAKVF